mgnify:CR=1 FL=1|jgi:cell division protein FtsL
MKQIEEYIAKSQGELVRINRDLKGQRILIAILIILALIVCFKAMSLAIDYEALNQEKQALEDLTETQSSMISDLEENCKDLYIEIENLKFGGNK